MERRRSGSIVRVEWDRGVFIRKDSPERW